MDPILKSHEALCGVDTTGKYAQRPIDENCGCGAPDHVYDNNEGCYICRSCGHVFESAYYTNPVIY